MNNKQTNKNNVVMIENAIWITWEYQVRNRNLSSILGIPLFEIVIPELKKMRYVLSLIRTIKILVKHRPKYVFHQSPSIVLAFFIAVLQPFFRYRTIIDCHNAGLKPNEGKSGILNGIAKLSLKRAHLVIMHNEVVAQKSPKNLKQLLVLPDPIPEVNVVAPKSAFEQKKKVVFICRWAEDEPYSEVIKMARSIESKAPHITIYITGRPPKAVLQKKLPANIKLTGFLSHQDYNELLNDSYALIALTNRCDSLNCAGYEALAYSKPVVLSDSKTLKNFFNKGCLFTNNSSDDLEVKLFDLINKYDELVTDIEVFKHNYSTDYLTRLKKLKLLIS